MAKSERTSIQVKRNTLQQVRRLKRRGQSYDDLLTRMAEQYDPEEAFNDD